MGKAHASYTVSDIKRLDLSFLKKNANDEQISKMRENINYISRITNDLGHDRFNNRPFLKTFNKPFYDYEIPELNKVIADSLEEEKQKLINLVNVDGQFELLNSQLESPMFNNNMEESIKAKLEDLEYSRENMQSRANEYYEKFNEYIQQAQCKLSEIDECYEILENLNPSSKNDKAIEQIKKVIETGEWIYLGSYAGDTQSSYLKVKHSTLRQRQDSHANSSESKARGHMFLTTKPIICSYVNHAANVSMATDFGYFLVGLDNSGAITYSRFAINHMGNKSTFHPHFSNNSICWGNSSYRYQKAVNIVTPNFVAVLNLVKALAETYCPDNPYIKLKTATRANNRRYLTSLPANVLTRIPPEIFDEELRTRLQRHIDLNLKRDAAVDCIELASGNDYLSNWLTTQHGTDNPTANKILKLKQAYANLNLQSCWRTSDGTASLDFDEGRAKFFSDFDIPAADEADLVYLANMNLGSFDDFYQRGYRGALFAWLAFSGIDTLYIKGSYKSVLIVNPAANTKLDYYSEDIKFTMYEKIDLNDTDEIHYTRQVRDVRYSRLDGFIIPSPELLELIEEKRNEYTN